MKTENIQTDSYFVSLIKSAMLVYYYTGWYGGLAVLIGITIFHIIFAATSYMQWAPTGEFSSTELAFVSFLIILSINLPLGFANLGNGHLAKPNLWFKRLISLTCSFAIIMTGILLHFDFINAYFYLVTGSVLLLRAEVLKEHAIIEKVLETN